jgi:hypothetical protein
MTAQKLICKMLRKVQYDTQVFRKHNKFVAPWQNTKHRFTRIFIHICILCNCNHNYYLNITSLNIGWWIVWARKRPIYRVSQEECAKLRESVPYIKVYRYNPKHLNAKLNGYWDNSQRQLGGFLRFQILQPAQLTVTWHSSCPWDWFQEWTVCMRTPKCAVSKVLSVLPYSWLYMRHVKCLETLRTTTALMRVFM